VSSLNSANTNHAAIARVVTEQQRAMLRTVSLDLLVQECARRGHQVCLHTICRLAVDRLPPGYPPLADDDITFNAEADRRE
jgi:hypothetical protein